MKKFMQYKKGLIRVAKLDALVILKRALRILFYQIKIRPRARLFAKFILILMVLFEVSSVAIAHLKPKEAEIKINGQAILVAQGAKRIPETEVEISQNLSAKLSPFEFAKPVSGYVSQGYSWYHQANDIADSLGAPIHPVGPGVVEFADFEADGKGNVVIVDHGDGLKSLYAHMGRIDVGVGNSVTGKTMLGTVGLTGRTTGPHVHLEIYDHDQAINPASVLPEDGN